MQSWKRDLDHCIAGILEWARRAGVPEGSGSVISEKHAKKLKLEVQAEAAAKGKADRDDPARCPPP